jgi:hypothetical protein
VSRATSVWVVFAALVAATSLAPTAALAQRGPGGGGGGGRGGVGGAQGTTINAAGVRVSGMGMVNAAGVRVSGRPGSFGSRVPGQQHHNRVGHRHHRGLVGSGPTLWYGYGGVPYYYPYYPAYYPQAYYDQAPTYVYVPPSYTTDMIAPPPPMQRVVEYPTGRYELRGDGYGTPYHWIWIPNPPSAPPAPTQPAPSVPPASGTPEPPAKTTVYRWTDAEGTVHFTDRLDSVPARYRLPARSGRAS